MDSVTRFESALCRSFLVFIFPSPAHECVLLSQSSAEASSSSSSSSHQLDLLRVAEDRVQQLESEVARLRTMELGWQEKVCFYILSPALLIPSFVIGSSHPATLFFIFNFVFCLCCFAPRCHLHSLTHTPSLHRPPTPHTHSKHVQVEMWRSQIAHREAEITRLGERLASEQDWDGKLALAEREQMQERCQQLERQLDFINGENAKHEKVIMMNLRIARLPKSLNQILMKNYLNRI